MQNSCLQNRNKGLLAHWYKGVQYNEMEDGMVEIPSLIPATYFAWRHGYQLSTIIKS